MRGIIMQEMSVLGLIRGVKTQTRRLAKDWAAPLYRVGETLYVKEEFYRGEWTEEHFYNDVNGESRSSVTWCRPSEGDRESIAFVVDGDPPGDRCERWVKVSQLFLPAWAARFHVTIVEVRRQRLLEITDVDADAEGIDVMHGWLEDVDICRAAKLIPHCGPEDSRAWYLAAWDTMHKRDAPAASNPVVDAYTFTVARC